MFSKVNKSGCFNHGRASSIRITRMFIEHNRTPKFSKVFRFGEEEEQKLERSNGENILPPLFIFNPQSIFTINLELRKLATHGYGTQITKY